MGFTVEEKELMERFPGTVGTGTMRKRVLNDFFNKHGYEFTEDVVVPVTQMEIDDLPMGVCTDVYHRASDIARDNGTRKNV